MSQQLESPPILTAPDDTHTSWGLAITGFLMIAALFVWANPSFGAKTDKWPWNEFLASKDLLFQAVLAMWGVAGLWALATAFTPLYRVRAGVAWILALMLIARSPHLIREFEMSWFGRIEVVALILLGAGLFTGSRDGGGHLGRRLAGLGALFYLAQFAEFTFTQEGTQWRPAFLFENVAEWTLRDDYLIQQLMLLLVAFIGAFAFFGLKSKPVLFWSFIVLVGAMLVPLGYGIYETTRDADADMQAFASVVHAALVQQGVLLFLLGAFGLSDFRSRNTVAA